MTQRSFQKILILILRKERLDILGAYKELYKKCLAEKSTGMHHRPKIESAFEEYTPPLPKKLFENPW